MTETNFRNVRRTNFTQIHNKMLWNSELSLQAKGLLSIFISNTEDWKINMKEIIKRSKNGRDSHYRIVKELIKFGHFARVKIKGEKGFEKMEYIFSDITEDVENELEYIEKEMKKNNKIVFIEYKNRSDEKDEILHTENQDAGNQDAENQDTENQYINNNNLNNTKDNNNNLNKTNQSIKEEDIENTELPLPIQKTLQTNKDRLIDLDVSLETVKITCNAFKENTPLDTIRFILESILTNTKTEIKNFKNYFQSSIINYYKQIEKQKEARKEEPQSNEIIPDWFHERKQSKRTGTEQTEKSEEQEIQELEENLSKHFSNA